MKGLELKSSVFHLGIVEKKSVFEKRISDIMCIFCPIRLKKGAEEFVL